MSMLTFNIFNFVIKYHTLKLKMTPIITCKPRNLKFLNCNK